MGLNRSDQNSGDQFPLAAEIAFLSQLGGGESRTGCYTGTKALMLAVFEDAIRSYMNSASRSHGEADRWVHDERRRSPFSFCVICDTLGLDPSAVRKALDIRARTGQLIKRVRPNTRRNSSRSLDTVCEN